MPSERMYEFNEIFDRFVFAVRPVEVPQISLHVSHPPPSWLNKQAKLQESLEEVTTPIFKEVWNVERQMRVQFPETRLIQYDSGKLQTLDRLLQMLKPDKHRALIFTQMTKMLDVLEKFLTYHGHIYLRLDGTTKVEQRQIMMERFNQDARIFVFILSTRSGGIGVNLTGADTVIFYDSDWNPTMDAQAQDRCHRIGQTRDVHIYRLICEKTVEENILKKADEKRLLGDIAIEGGNFNTAFFKKNTLKDLFEVRKNEKESKRRDKRNILHIQERDVAIENVGPPAASIVAETKTEKKEIAAFEQALFKAEDEQDVRAASTAKAEQVAEMAEFNENVPIKNNDNNEEGKSKVEEELAVLESELTSVERYALKYLESTSEYLNDEEIEDTEKHIELAKKDWELEHLQAKREAEERKNAVEEDDMFFTYAKDESYEQVPTPKSNSNVKVASIGRGSERKISEKDTTGRPNESSLVEIVNTNSPCVARDEDDVDVTVDFRNQCVENGLSIGEQDNDNVKDSDRTTKSPRKRRSVDSALVESRSGRSSRQSCSSGGGNSRSSSRSSSKNRAVSRSSNSSPVYSPNREAKKRKSITKL